MDPVDGHILAKLPDLGGEEEGWVNNGLLGGNPHLGVLHLHIHGLSFIYLQEDIQITRRSRGERGLQILYLSKNANTTMGKISITSTK